MHFSAVPGFVSNVVLAATSPSPTPTAVAIDPARVSPGLLGLASLVFLAVAVFVIWKSMNKQLKRIDFDEDATTTD